MSAASPVPTLLLQVRQEDGRWRMRLQGGGRLVPQVRRKLYGLDAAEPASDAGLLWESSEGEGRQEARSQARAAAGQLESRGFELLAEAAEDAERSEATYIFYPRLAAEFPCKEAEDAQWEAALPDPVVLRLSGSRGEAEGRRPRFKVSHLSASAGFERRLRERAHWLWSHVNAPERLALHPAGVEALCSAIAASGHRLSAVVGDMHIFKRSPAEGDSPPRAGHAAVHAASRRGGCPRSRVALAEVAGGRQGAVCRCSGLCAGVLENLARKEVPKRPSAWHVVQSLPQDLEPKVVSVEDVKQGTAEAAKLIRISCPGTVSQDGIEVESIPNGVSVRIEGVARSRAFKHDFCFDHRTDGHLTLCEEQCNFQSGELQLYLRRSPQRRLRLGSLRGSAPSPMQETEDQAVALEVFPMTPTNSEAASSSAPSSPSSDWYFIPESRGSLLQHTSAAQP